MYIAIEGPDGTGKSTQVKMLCERLTEVGFPVKHVQEPGDNQFGISARAHLRGQIELSESALQDAFRLDREYTLKYRVLPHIQRSIVISDRCFLSTIVYQDMPLKEFAQSECNKMGIRFFTPDVVYVLLGSSSVLDERLNSREGKKEVFEDTATQHKVRRKYRELAEMGVPWVVGVPCDDSINAVNNRILDHLMLSYLKTQK